MATDDAQPITLEAAWDEVRGILHTHTSADTDPTARAVAVAIRLQGLYERLSRAIGVSDMPSAVD